MGLLHEAEQTNEYTEEQEGGGRGIRGRRSRARMIGEMQCGEIGWPMHAFILRAVVHVRHCYELNSNVLSSSPKPTILSMYNLFNKYCVYMMRACEMCYI